MRGNNENLTYQSLEKEPINWQAFAADNGLVYHSLDDTAIQQRAGSLFRTSWHFTLKKLDSVEGEYDSLPFELGTLRLQYNPRGISVDYDIVFLKLQLPAPLPRVAVDHIRSMWSTTKSDGLKKDGQWLRPPEDMVGQVNLRCTRGFEDHVADIISPDMLRELLQQQKQFSIEIMYDEMYIYFYERPTALAQSFGQLLRLVGYIDQAKIRAVSPGSPLPTLPIPARTKILPTGVRHPLSKNKRIAYVVFGAIALVFYGYLLWLSGEIKGYY